jgi:hypothetical protein
VHPPVFFHWRFHDSPPINHLPQSTSVNVHSVSSKHATRRQSSPPDHSSGAQMIITQAGFSVSNHPNHFLRTSPFAAALTPLTNLRGGFISISATLTLGSTRAWHILTNDHDGWSREGPSQGFSIAFLPPLRTFDFPTPCGETKGRRHCTMLEFPGSDPSGFHNGGASVIG